MEFFYDLRSNNKLVTKIRFVHVGQKNLDSRTSVLVQHTIFLPVSDTVFVRWKLSEAFGDDFSHFVVASHIPKTISSHYQHVRLAPVFLVVDMQNFHLPFEKIHQTVIPYTNKHNASLIAI